MDIHATDTAVVFIDPHVLRIWRPMPRNNILAAETGS
jgi:hypothetical protein